MIIENIRHNELTTVITTFHSQEKIYKCIDSIDSRIKIILVDNSNDIDFQNDIKKKYKNVEITFSGENLGYAKGNNLGLSKVKTKYALILNPDVIVEKNTIDNFFKLIKEIKNFAIIAPETQDEKNYELETKKQNLKLYEVEKVKGFAMFFNIKEFSEIGFFDENFFIYLEETDLCLRLKKKNKKIFLCSEIRFIHSGGSSHNESINFEMELSRNWHWMWSSFYFNKKHYGFSVALFKVSGKLFSSFLKTILYLIVFNKRKKKIYYQRFSGLMNSIFGKKSWYRPKIF